MSAFCIYDMCWTENQCAAVCALEDGSIKAYLMDVQCMKKNASEGRPIKSISWRGDLPGAFCCIDATGPSILSQQGMDTIAYAGEDGVVGIMSATYKYVSKKRKDAHIPFVGLRVDDQDRFILQSTEELKKWMENGGVYEGRIADRAQAMKKSHGKLSDTRQTIHCLRWSPDTSKGRWLAYGNGQGIIHCSWVPSRPDRA